MLEPPAVRLRGGRLLAGTAEASEAAVHRRRKRSCGAQGVLHPVQKGQLRAPAQQRE